jgi:hypothetical protein
MEKVSARGCGRKGRMTKLNEMYIVDLFTDNNWSRHSWHNNQDIAEINAEVVVQSRKCNCRIVKEGTIISEIKYGGVNDG